MGAQQGADKDCPSQKGSTKVSILVSGRVHIHTRKAPCNVTSQAEEGYWAEVLCSTECLCANAAALSRLLQASGLQKP